MITRFFASCRPGLVLLGILPPIRLKEPEAEPALSCLTRGVIKSLNEEWDSWETKRSRFYLHLFHKNGLRLSMDNGYLTDTVMIEREILALHEANAVRAAYNHQVGLLFEMEKLEEERAAAPKLEYFIKLGCPERTAADQHHA